MSDRSRAKTALLRVAPILGVGLLAYLLSTVKLSALTVNAKTIGWGMLLVIALGGLSHVIKTWAWRLTLAAEARKVSFARMLGLRLISEAIGQFGFLGMLGGEAARVSLLGSRSLRRWCHKLGGTGSHSLHPCGCGSHHRRGRRASSGCVSIPCCPLLCRSPRGWIAVAVGCRGNCDPEKVAGAFRARPRSRSHSGVPEMGAQQGSNSQTQRSSGLQRSTTKRRARSGAA